MFANVALVFSGQFVRYVSQMKVGVRVRMRARVRVRVRVRVLVLVLTHARGSVLARSGLGEAPSPLGAARASNPRRRVRAAIDLLRIRVGDRVRD